MSLSGKKKAAVDPASMAQEETNMAQKGTAQPPTVYAAAGVRAWAPGVWRYVPGSFLIAGLAGLTKWLVARESSRFSRPARIQPCWIDPRPRCGAAGARIRAGGRRGGW